ncbi:transcriptional antiterminator [Lacticaseibacillus zeae DSM 20178 = KCTC 3804]|uniref:Ascorbate-specific PTS system EIIA component n=1 Tax=Lacticaseibacillus zeae DSM 20178 = KCTC 3804 TaxID=1423816 RepID=A0A0R1ESV0_LACZE|nr:MULTISPECIES: BglG family transcription antiterminator [Lacticaseibacillus]KLI74670.1 transcriptional antiterminator [Lacticaseibacillus casei]KRK12460.1 transcriptional antiterminator [Lacticaseibacillus zeae DSM 20178 = KCTC 3804]QVI32387.1 transcription antiterminator [Lacticaseibacillus zeae]
MNKREARILSEIIRHPKIDSIKLQQMMGLTGRQLSYSIGHINDALNEQGLPAVKKLGDGSLQVKDEVFRFLAKSDDAFKFDNYHEEEERMYLTLLYLLTTSDNVSLNHVVDYLGISKTTAEKDIRRTRSFLKQRHEMLLKYTRTNGYFIQGSEVAQRLVLNDTVLNLQQYSDSQDVISKTSRVGIEEVVHYAREVEKHLDVTYSDDAFVTLVNTLAVNITRNLSGRVKDSKYFDDELTDTTELASITSATNPDWVRSKADLEWLTLIFLSSNTLRGAFQDEQSPILSAVEKMVNQFEQDTLVKIPNRKAFDKQLLAHLRPAYFRVKYGMHLANIGVDKVFREDSWHKMLFETVKNDLKPLEKLVGKSFPTEEVKLITFYFGGVLESRKQPDNNQHRAAVVCTNGIISARLMFEHLVRLFPEITFLSATSVHDFEAFDRDYDLVFSTVPLNTHARQYIIHPLMTTEESINLRFRVLNDLGISTQQGSVDQVLQIVKKHATVRDAKGLKNDILAWLVKSNISQDEETKESQLPSLKHYLKPELVQVVDASMDWEKALRFSVAPLLDRGIVTQHFEDVLVKQTKDPRSFAFLGTRMAIPHTLPENGALSEAFGFSIFKTPVLFPGKEAISIIVPISLRDTTRHLRAIQQLSRIAEDTELIDKLINTNSSEVAYHLILENIQDQKKQGGLKLEY